MMMNRRIAIARVAQLMGSTVALPSVFAITQGCKTTTDAVSAAFTSFTPEQLNLVSEVAEVIIPKTSTPGAKEANVGEFIQTMIRDCYEPVDQESFLAGLADLEKRGFVAASADEKTKILTELEKAAAEQGEKVRMARESGSGQRGTQNAADDKNKRETKEEDRYQEAGTAFKKPAKAFFSMAKELTLLGYFTSEPGTTQALDYIPVPGRYDGCIDLKPGDKVSAL